MAGDRDRKLVLVTRRTRLEELVARYHSLAQARFYLEHLGADFSDYEREQETYVAAKQSLLPVLESWGRYQIIERAFLPNFLFGPDDILIALGQDGLVANSLKYLDGQPLIGVNPDPGRFDGLLLPFQPQDLSRILDDLSRGRRPVRTISMAEAVLNNGQRLLGVNDLFIGPRTHISARYAIELAGSSEVQSSSGVIVSTGLGSSAWMKSIVTGSLAIAGAYGASPCQPYQPWDWSADYLQFAVREPYPSRSSAASLVFGRIPKGENLVLRSLMPEQGVIFSDGIEADFLNFTSGLVAEIRVAAKQGMLVI